RWRAPTAHMHRDAGSRYRACSSPSSRRARRAASATLPPSPGSGDPAVWRAAGNRRDLPSCALQRRRFRSFTFGRDLVVTLLERRAQRVPGETRALHPQRKARHTAERAQRAEGGLLTLRQRAEHEIVKLPEQLLGLVARLALDRRRHER